jgi:hypothetical protein
MKDFTVSCVSFAPSGTVLSHPSKTLYEIIPAKSTKEYEGVEIGPVYKQAFMTRCRIADAVSMR